MMSSSQIHIKMAKCVMEVGKTINKEQSELVIGKGTLPGSCGRKGVLLVFNDWHSSKSPVSASKLNNILFIFIFEFFCKNDHQSSSECTSDWGCRRCLCYIGNSQVQVWVNMEIIEEKFSFSYNRGENASAAFSEYFSNWLSFGNTSECNSGNAPLAFNYSHYHSVQSCTVSFINRR